MEIHVPRLCCFFTADETAVKHTRRPSTKLEVTFDGRYPRTEAAPSEPPRSVPWIGDRGGKGHADDELTSGLSSASFAHCFTLMAVASIKLAVRQVLFPVRRLLRSGMPAITPSHVTDPNVLRSRFAVHGWISDVKSQVVVLVVFCRYTAAPSQQSPLFRCPT